MGFDQSIYKVTKEELETLLEITEFDDGVKYFNDDFKNSFSHWRITNSRNSLVYWRNRWDNDDVIRKLKDITVLEDGYIWYFQEGFTVDFDGVPQKFKDLTGTHDFKDLTQTNEYYVYFRSY